MERQRYNAKEIFRLLKYGAGLMGMEDVVMFSSEKPRHNNEGLYQTNMLVWQELTVSEDEARAASSSSVFALQTR